MKCCLSTQSSQLTHPQWLSGFSMFLLLNQSSKTSCEFPWKGTRICARALAHPLFSPKHKADIFPPSVRGVLVRAQPVGTGGPSKTFPRSRHGPSCPASRGGRKVSCLEKGNSPARRIQPPAHRTQHGLCQAFEKKLCVSFLHGSNPQRT